VIITPFACAAASISSHSCVVIASGFSQTTCRRACRHLSASGACVLCGVMMEISSTSLPASIASTPSNI
jgi:hypothetical protein